MLRLSSFRPEQGFVKRTSFTDVPYVAVFTALFFPPPSNSPKRLLLFASIYWRNNCLIDCCRSTIPAWDCWSCHCCLSHFFFFFFISVLQETFMKRDSQGEGEAWCEIFMQRQSIGQFWLFLTYIFTPKNVQGLMWSWNILVTTYLIHCSMLTPQKW